MKFYQENNVNPLGPACRWSRSCRCSSRCTTCCARACARTSAPAFSSYRAHTRPHTCRCTQPATRRPAAPATARASCSSTTSRQGHGRRPDRPDRPLRRHAARLEPDDVGADDGPDAAKIMLFMPLIFVLVRDPLPGRRARLLDHDEHWTSPSSTRAPIQSALGGGRRWRVGRRRRWYSGEASVWQAERRWRRFGLRRPRGACASGWPRRRSDADAKRTSGGTSTGRPPQSSPTERQAAGRRRRAAARPMGPERIVPKRLVDPAATSRPARRRSAQDGGDTDGASVTH